MKSFGSDPTDYSITSAPVYSSSGYSVLKLYDNMGIILKGCIVVHPFTYSEICNRNSECLSST